MDQNHEKLNQAWFSLPLAKPVSEKNRIAKRSIHNSLGEKLIQTTTGLLRGLKLVSWNDSSISWLVNLCLSKLAWLCGLAYSQFNQPKALSPQPHAKSYLSAQQELPSKKILKDTLNERGSLYSDNPAAMEPTTYRSIISSHGTREVPRVGCSMFQVEQGKFHMHHQNFYSQLQNIWWAPNQAKTLPRSKPVLFDIPISFLLLLILTWKDGYL